MADSWPPLFLYILLPLITIFLLTRKRFPRKNHHSTAPNLPKSYPILGSAIGILKHIDRFCQWSGEIVNSSPSLTVTFDLPLGRGFVLTANSAVVEHMLKTKFELYEKGEIPKSTLRDFLGDGIFNVDGEQWKLQRSLASHEFNIKSLRRFLHSVVNIELSRRLIPALKLAAEETRVIDFQEILQRFGFDNICQIAFGYDPEYLSPSPAPQNDEFAAAFETATRLSGERFNHLISHFWRMKRALNLGSEKELKSALVIVQAMARSIIRRKKKQIEAKSSMDEADLDLLSRFLSSGFSDEKLVMDLVIAFILAGQDTTSTALTWLFFLLSKNPRVEDEILREIRGKVSESAAYDEVKQLVYTHAAICESMRLFPPVPMDSRIAARDDVLPDGTAVKKGWIVGYNTYAMGRCERLWGGDWAEFRPERWLERAADGGGRWSFVNRDSYSYPVFHAGPRTCLGKGMAFIQMKSVVAGVLQEFRVVPVGGGESEPNFSQQFVAKMKGGFQVRIERRGV